MARSIHDTWGVLARARRADWSDPAALRAIEAETRGNLRRQRAVREGERRIRRGGDRPPPPVDPDRLPILVDDEAPYVFHAATEEDVRAVLRRLPPGSLDGLQAVRLCLDHREATEGSGVRDPFLGRRRHEIIPGVYAGPVLGSYQRSTATLRLHAYLCDPGQVAPFALYFKLRALRTLLHEAAHHFDLTFRVGRSRWDVDDREKDEAWADRVEDDQSLDVLPGYVRERYLPEHDAFKRWLEEHAGTTLPPVTFLMNEREVPLFQGFHGLVRAVLSGGDREAARATFARTLHASGANKYAAQVVAAVLERHPDHPGALAVSACLSLCGKRDFEAVEALCQRALAADPACFEAREVRVRSQAIQERWDRAATACEEALALVAEGDTGHGLYVLETLIESRLLLGQLGEVEAAIARLRARGTAGAARRAQVYEVLALCWAGQWEPAFLRASRLLATGDEARLAAARFESAHRLGRPHLAGAFGERDLARLERSSFTRAWAGRIRDLTGGGGRGVDARMPP